MNSTMKVWFMVANSEQLLFPGMTGQVKIQLKEIKSEIADSSRSHEMTKIGFLLKPERI